MTQPQSIAQYQIIDELGRGGFATVYRARDTALERDVALKVLAGNFTREPAFVERFRREARIAANLQHPNIVPVYNFGEADGALYLAMALVGQGRILRDLLAETSPLSLERALLILGPLADALDHLHKQAPPLTHRDVKPANVLLAGNVDTPWVLLTDFGLVRSMEASAELTQSGTILGTPAYLAPEQADPKQWGEITPLTDIYALGVVAYEMLVGQQPFVGELARVLHAHAYELPPSPLEIVPSLVSDLAEVLTRALARPPAERYPSAGALVAALRQVSETHTRQEREQAELAHLLAQARAAREAGDWLSVQDLSVQAMQTDRTHPDALGMMAEATAGLQRESAEEAARRQRARRYEEGERALAGGQWQAAIAAFEEVAEDNPDFRDVQEELAQARDELQRAQWYDEAIAHGEAERWVEACRVWGNVLRGRWDYRGGDAVERLLGATERLSGEKLTLDEALVNITERLSSEKLTLEALVTVVDRKKEWECLLFQSAHNKRSGKLSKATRRFIGKLCQDCAQSQDATLLLAALDNSDHHVRRFAAKALGELSGRFEVEQKIIVPKLMEVAADDSDAGTRWRAVWALGAMRPSSSVGEIIDLLCKFLVADEKNDTVRWRAAWALGEMKAKDALDTLISVALNKGEKESVRRAAIRALGAIQSPQAEKALSGLASHGEGKLSELAEWALQEVVADAVLEGPAMRNANEPETLLDDEEYLSAATLARLKELTFEE